MNAEHLQEEVNCIFNGILNRPTGTPIIMERLHRALRPKGKDTEPPRDVVCCIVDYQLKEELLSRARAVAPLVH